MERLWCYMERTGCDALLQNDCLDLAGSNIGLAILGRFATIRSPSSRHHGSHRQLRSTWDPQQVLAQHLCLFPPHIYSFISRERCGMHTHYWPSISVSSSLRTANHQTYHIKQNHSQAKTRTSKATKEISKDLVALPASPVKGTVLFPRAVTPVALGAADPDAPVVPGA